MQNFCYSAQGRGWKMGGIRRLSLWGLAMIYLNRLAVVLGAVLLYGTPLSSSADAYEDGVAAYRAGHYHDALGIWKWLAATGNVDAKFRLGLMYELGQGVAPDAAAALTWFLQAANEGHEQARYGVTRMLQRDTAPRRAPAKRFVLASATLTASAPE
jgi:TPR repeat protein